MLKLNFKNLFRLTQPVRSKKKTKQRLNFQKQEILATTLDLCHLANQKMTRKGAKKIRDCQENILQLNRILFEARPPFTGKTTKSLLRSQRVIYQKNVVLAMDRFVLLHLYRVNELFCVTQNNMNIQSAQRITNGLLLKFQGIE